MRNFAHTRYVSHLLPLAAELCNGRVYRGTTRPLRGRLSIHPVSVHFCPPESPETRETPDPEAPERRRRPKQPEAVTSHDVTTRMRLDSRKSDYSESSGPGGSRASWYSRVTAQTRPSQGSALASDASEGSVEREIMGY